MIGIYKIMLPGCRYYIGQSINLARRRREHWSDLQRNEHGNTALQNIYNKYGFKDFEFVVLTECARDELNELEQLILDACADDPLCMNIARNVQEFKQPRKPHDPLTAEHKDKIGLANSRPIVGVSPTGEKIHFAGVMCATRYFEYVDCATNATIMRSLKKRRVIPRGKLVGWYFYYQDEGDYIPTRQHKRIKGVSPSGDIIVWDNGMDAARYFNKSYTLYSYAGRKIKIGNCKDWTFSFVDA